ncbi:MAG TPA: hypothetical protein VLI54_01440 [Bacillota bacterium]|nr:hypothetical protein [Bacillota bacterium]
MIKKQSDDPDVEVAAHQALGMIDDALNTMPVAATYDYGGHIMRLDEYDMCTRCTGPIAEAQAAHDALLHKAQQTSDDTVKEHIELAAELFRVEAEAAKLRAELHNGHGTEKILNSILGFIHNRTIHDSYDHSHNAQRGN